MRAVTASAKDERARALAGFLARSGWGEAERRVLAGDASFRRYDRLRRGDGASAVLMDAPPPMENVRPFQRIAGLLLDHGFSAPRILAADADRGFLLLEDLGDDTYNRRLAAGDDEVGLYALAVDALIALHRRLTPAALAALPEHDEVRCQREVALLLDWYWPAVFGIEAPASARAAAIAAWAEVLPGRRAVPASIALFDFHVDNLLLLEGREGVKACGLLDFQDAVRAPLAFDLVSLLEDVRRDVPAPLAERMIDRYLGANAELDRDAFMTAYKILAAQRNTRIAGTFARLLKRDGKRQYQQFMPRLWSLLAADLAHPALAPVAAWYEEFLPPSRRVSLA